MSFTFFPFLFLDFLHFFFLSTTIIPVLDLCVFDNDILQATSPVAYNIYYISLIRIPNWLLLNLILTEQLHVSISSKKKERYFNSNNIKKAFHTYPLLLISRECLSNGDMFFFFLIVYIFISTTQGPLNVGVVTFLFPQPLLSTLIDVR